MRAKKISTSRATQNYFLVSSGNRFSCHWLWIPKIHDLTPDNSPLYSLSILSKKIQQKISFTKIKIWNAKVCLENTMAIPYMQIINAVGSRKRLGAWVTRVGMESRAWRTLLSGFHIEQKSLPSCCKPLGEIIYGSIYESF